MNARRLLLGAAVGLTAAAVATAGDWPQWRGPNRDARVTGFDAPKTWPKELTRKWKVAVGDGVATPSLVGDKLYVFARQGGDEVFRCLDAGTGKELWQDKYPAKGATGAASGFPGPRATPTVADGKVVTFGVSGALSCYDAASGKKLWGKDVSGGTLPRFFTSSSPVVADGLCVVQIGGESSGGVVAYDLATGDEKWKWSGDGTAYASPTLMTVDGVKAVVAETAKNLVALGLADGKLLWQTAFAVQGRGYNSASPMVEGQTLMYAGSNRGTKAVKVEKQGDKLTTTELWSNPGNSVIYNTPVLKDGMLFGLSANDELFCIDAKTGKTLWTETVKGRKGYGSVVDAGPVLLSLTPSAQLIAFEPSAKEFKEVASYKVSDTESTYAYPVVTGNKVYIKDKDSVALWAFE
jgi:outer membrane protein assembly factor BamB